MGFFSWKTQDTKRSICNSSSHLITFKVLMTDNKGNKWVENNYGGYGIFGGKDFYELLAEMNGKVTRSEGISLWFGTEGFLSPNLTEDQSWTWKDEKPEDCPDQGFFYQDDEEYFNENEEY